MDSFGHVNNAVYLSYLEDARWHAFEQQGWLDYLKVNQLFPVIISYQLNYRRELRMMEPFSVETRWSLKGDMLINHHIIRNHTGQKVLTAVAKLLLVDQNRRGVSLPAEFRQMMEQSHGANTAN